MNIFQEISHKLLYDPVLSKRNVLKRMLDKHVEICPAILEEEKEMFEFRYNQVKNDFEQIDVDILDGTLFSDLVTWELSGIFQFLNDVMHASILAKLSRMPDIGLHFMIEKPERYFEIELPLCVREIVICYETGIFTDPDRLAIFRKYQQAHRDLEFGVSVNPTTDIDEVLTMLDRENLNIHLLQLMTVQPGKQGNEFKLKSFRKCGDIKEKYRLKIDGAINPITLGSLDEADKKLLEFVDAVSVGSYLKG